MNLNDQINARIDEIAAGKLVAERRDEVGNLICYYCGDPIGKYSTHRDHITPKSRGGRNDFWNIALTCADCNIRKSIRPPLYMLGHIPEELQLDYLARILAGGALANRRFSPGDNQETPTATPILDIADKISALSRQLEDITKWMHKLEQEVENLAIRRESQS